MADERLALPALCAWVGAWAGTSLASHTSCVAQPHTRGCLGYVSVPHFASLALLALLALLSALALTLHHLRTVRTPPARHVLVPAGSLRLGAALALLALAASLTVGMWSAARYLSSPALVRVVTSGHFEGVVRLEEDRAPSSEAAWVWGTVLATHTGTWERDSGGVRVLLEWTPTRPVARGSTLLVRGPVDRDFAASPPSLGAIRKAEVRVRDGPHGLETVGATLRAALRERVAGRSPQVRALVPGMAAGDDSAAPKSLVEAMRTSSLAHLTAVSGTHVAVLLTAVSLLLPARGPWRLGGVLAALGGTLLLAGPAPSVLRACLMALVAASGLLLGRRGRSLTGLALAVLVLTVMDPWASRSIGLALSVAATWVMVVLAPGFCAERRAEEPLVCEQRSGPWPHVRALLARLTRSAWALARLSFAIQVVTAPLLLLLGPDLPAWSVAANLLVAPVIAPACLLCSLAAWSAWCLPGLADMAVTCAVPLVEWIAGVAQVVSHWPGARLPAPCAAALCAALAALAALRRWQRRRRQALRRCREEEAGP